MRDGYLAGILAMKITIALIENLSQRLDDALPYLLNMCIQELLSLKPKVAKNF
jgi:hypothetical protein